MRGEDEVICYFGPGKAWVLGVGEVGGGAGVKTAYGTFVT